MRHSTPQHLLVPRSPTLLNPSHIGLAALLHAGTQVAQTRNYVCTYVPRRAAGSLDVDPPELSGLHAHARTQACPPAHAGLPTRVRGPAHPRAWAPGMERAGARIHDGAARARLPWPGVAHSSRLPSIASAPVITKYPHAPPRPSTSFPPSAPSTFHALHAHPVQALHPRPETYRSRLRSLRLAPLSDSSNCRSCCSGSGAADFFCHPLRTLSTTATVSAAQASSGSLLSRSRANNIAPTEP